jgi:hypothetical protein
MPRGAPRGEGPWCKQETEGPSVLSGRYGDAWLRSVDYTNEGKCIQAQRGPMGGVMVSLVGTFAS